MVMILDKFLRQVKGLVTVDAFGVNNWWNCNVFTIVVVVVVVVRRHQHRHRVL